MSLTAGELVDQPRLWDNFHVLLLEIATLEVLRSIESAAEMAQLQRLHNHQPED